MSEEYTWWYGMGSEAESYLPAASRDDAVVKATEEAREGEYEEVTIAEARPLPLSDDVFGADLVLERFIEKNEEAQDEDGELRQMKTTPQQDRELELALAATLADWRKRHGVGRAYQLDVKSMEVIQVPATIETT